MPEVGNTIPKIFVVRADGEAMFAKSTSLPGETMHQVLDTCARHSGTILGPADIQLLNEVYEKVQIRQSRGDINGVVSMLGKVKRIGEPGAIGSFAESALKLDKVVAELVEGGLQKLETIKTFVSNESPEDEKVALGNLQYLIALGEQYASIPTLRQEVKAIEKLFKKDKDWGRLFKGVQLVEASYRAKTEGAIASTAKKLQDYIDENQTGVAVERAQRALDLLNKKSGQ